MENDTTFGASPLGLAGLLGIGATGNSAAEADQAAAELLRARLDGTLPLDSAVIDALPALPERFDTQLAPLGGRPLGQVLADRATDLKTIGVIKEYGKKLAARRDSAADHAAGIVIYYAAIASALLFHGKKITQHSIASLAHSFDLLVAKPWIPPDLLARFAEAKSLCENPTGTP